MKTFRTTACLALLFVLLAGLGVAQPAEAEWHVGLFAGGYQPEDDGEDDPDVTLSYGFEGGYRINSRFGLNGSVSRVDLADAFGLDDGGFVPFDPEVSIDLTALDLSLAWYPGGGKFVVFGGPGVAQIDFELDTFGPADEPFHFEEKEELLTAHLGLGYEWRLTDRLTLRPEGRVRWYFDDEARDEVEDDIFYEATDVEARVALTYRFGA